MRTGRAQRLPRRPQRASRCPYRRVYQCRAPGARRRCAARHPPLHAEIDVLGFAYTIERMLADVHLAPVATYRNRDYAKTAASILGVETTHVALLAEALRRNPAYPSSFVAA
ncbi:MAG: ferritin-like domain-containing protein [Candidatus Eremiobacteraeota bacterium]|nr:ferritin-like domain-containing protein [Candidatus Eremiobacteraeota bacterium]